MAETFTLYTSIQQPFPLRLPAVPAAPDASPEDLESCTLDLPAAAAAFRDVIGPAYGMALHRLAAYAEEGGALSVSVSESFLEMSRRWSADLIKPIRRLLRTEGVEPVATDPDYGLLFALDISRFAENMKRARESIELLADRQVATAEVSGFCLNREIYHALAREGYAALAADGAGSVTAGRSPGHLGRWGNGPAVMYRLEWLSDELRHHLRSGGEGAQRMADTISHLPGETALVEFDFDSLAFGGEGVALLASLAGECRQRGVEPISMGGAAGRFSDRASEHSPPTMTAMPGISVEDVGGVGWVESLIFGRMQQAYDMGRLVDIPAVRRLADRLLQRANLALPGLAAQANARPSSYTSMQWWALDPGYDATAEQVLALYDNFIQTMGRYAAQEAAT